MATKAANASIVNIASICGIRGSGKECISYQVFNLPGSAVIIPARPVVAAWTMTLALAWTLT